MIEKKYIDAGLDVIRKDLRHFARWTFNKVLEPNSHFLHNWHMDCMCEYLTACQTDQIKRLIINAPPRCFKSTLTSVIYPSWVMGQSAGDKFIISSYVQDVREKQGSDTLNIMRNPWFRIFYPDCRLQYNHQQKTSIITTDGGTIVRQPSNVAPTGVGCDHLIFDDYINVSVNIKGGKEKKDLLTNMREGYFSRENFTKKSKIIIVEQRLDAADVTAKLTHEYWKSMDYEHLILPAIEETGRIISFGNFKHEYKKGDYLIEHENFKASMDEKKNTLDVEGQKFWFTQYQQQPLENIGDQFKREWFVYESPEFFESIRHIKDNPIILSCDTALKEKRSADYSVICAVMLNLRNGKAYLLDVIRKRIDYSNLKIEVASAITEYKPQMVLIEDAASGSPLADEFIKGDVRSKETGQPIFANIQRIKPVGDKVARSGDLKSIVSSGRLVFPSFAPWLNFTEKELLAFPNDEHDDIVDSLSQWASYVRRNGFSVR